MKVLLDTHTFLWFVMGSANLSDNARSLIENPANEMLLSIASLWEIAIKASLGKVTLATPFADLIPAQLTLNGIALLNIRVDHLSRLVILPFHHRDPFDRLITSQALVEQIPVLGIDEVFDKYGVTRCW
jgi:PIN domain nuclease of toxin-antitoxin system